MNTPLKIARKRKNLTLMQVAELIKSDAGNISRIERGQQTPSKELVEISKGKKGILVSEINAGQMVQDVRLAIDGTLPVEHFGRLGGIVPEPEEIVKALKDKLVK